LLLFLLICNRRQDAVCFSYLCGDSCCPLTRSFSAEFVDVCLAWSIFKAKRNTHAFLGSLFCPGFSFSSVREMTTVSGINLLLETLISFSSCNLSYDSGNAYYHSVQNLLSSRLLSKNTKIKICRTIILPVVYGCET